MLTSAEISKLTGVSDRTIRDWQSKGILPKTHDLAVAIQAVIAHYKQEVAEARKCKDNDQLTAEKIRLIQAQADKVELEIAEREGELISARETLLVWSNYILACRAKLLSLPTKLAFELASISDPITIQETLTNTIDEALFELGGKVVESMGITLRNGEGISSTSTPDN